MKVFFVLCVALALAEAQIYKKGLRVKWGVPLPFSDVFIEIPRQKAEVISNKWEPTKRHETFLPSLQMYCPKDDLTLCAMYDDTDYIAGLQVCLSATNFTNPPFPLTSVGFNTWDAPDGHSYWCTQQFFVSEESLKKSKEERLLARRFNDKTLREDVVWLPTIDGKTLFKVNSTENEIANSQFTKQACIPTMGRHYYYETTPQSSCDALYPWFLITNNGVLHATGFVAFGTFPALARGQRLWFEKPPKLAVQVIVPRGPPCLYELAAKGIVTMHVYYDNHPMTVGC